MANMLIIDDDVMGARALATLLKGEGHQATCASSAGDALLHMREDDPDLVLIDLNMPEVDGFQLLDALRAEPRFAHVRFAVYSGRTEQSARDTAKKLGAQAFIRKGLDWPDTYDQIKACLPEKRPPAAPPEPFSVGAWLL